MDILQLLLRLFILSVCEAVCGYVYSVVLTQPDMIFAKLYELLQKKLPPKLFLMVIGCPYCVTGQLALWSYFYIAFHWFDYYNLMMHTWFICQSIFNLHFIKFIYERASVENTVDNFEKKELKAKQ